MAPLSENALLIKILQRYDNLEVDSDTADFLEEKYLKKGSLFPTKEQAYFCVYWQDKECMTGSGATAIWSDEGYFLDFSLNNPEGVNVSSNQKLIAIFRII